MPGERVKSLNLCRILDYQQKSLHSLYPQTYYIGTLVVFTRPDGDAEIIDGQQRFTTLSLLANWLKTCGIHAGYELVPRD
jgi:uncharacterized protein with ParB-like and HNH nuclease domain